MCGWQHPAAALAVCALTSGVIRRAFVRALIRIALVAAVLAAAGEASAQEPCCLPDGSCQELTQSQCDAAGGKFPGSIASCPVDPNYCIGCCRSGEPTTCEDHVTFVDCSNRPNLAQYGSPAVCSPGGDCVQAPPSPTPTVTPTATITLTPTITPTNTPIPQGGDCVTPSQCATGFCVDDVCCDTVCDQPGQICNQAGNRGVCTAPTAPAPTLTPRALLLALAVLGSLAAVALRRRARSGPAS